MKYLKDLVQLTHVLHLLLRFAAFWKREYWIILRRIVLSTGCKRYSRSLLLKVLKVFLFP